MPGTELCLCEGEQGEQLSAEVVACLSHPPVALLPRGCSNAEPVSGDRGYFIRRYPKGCTVDRTDTLRHFLDIKRKVHKQQYRRKTVLTNQTEQSYSSNLLLRTAQQGLQSTHPLPRSHEGEVLNAADSPCIAQY